MDFERRLRQRDEEIDRLKKERDRLVQISNELRAQLNAAERRILEQAEDALGGAGDEEERIKRDYIENEMMQIHM